MRKLQFQLAIEALAKTIAERPISGARHQPEDVSLESINENASSALRWIDRDRTLIDLRYERGWGGGCALRVRIVPEEVKGDKIWKMECEISWSSTGRSVTNALCAANLYREVIDLAAHLECQWNEWGVERAPQVETVSV